MTQIDFTRPLELSDGTPVTLRKQPDQAYPYIDVVVRGVLRSFDSSGKHWNFPGVTLRNAENTALDTTKALQTVDGKKVSFIGKLEDGRLVVSITYNLFGRPTSTELRFADGRKSSRLGETSGDDVIVKITEKVVFQNVYADGTTGATQHASAEAAAQRSKYGKVRIGILKTTLRDGVRFSAVVTPATVPWYRDASVSSGRAATPEDFAR